MVGGRVGRSSVELGWGGVGSWLGLAWVGLG